jgi:predicted CoA-binding protein
VPAVDDAAIAGFLRTVRTAAVVGLSPRPDRPSHEVAAYLQAHGVRVLPVNPHVAAVLGERSYPDLAALPEAPDVVVVFRRPDEVPPVAAAAVARGARGLWLQPGIAHPQAERQAQEAGLFVIADRCIRLEHARLLGG